MTDAWAPQVNGVVVTLENTVRWMRRWGHEVEVISPEGFRTIPMPTYPEIPLAVMPGSKVARRIREIDPDAIHIATEGPLGAAARAYCVKHGVGFTTAYHTCFPEYVKPRFGVPLAITYAWLRRFHAASSAVLVATPAIRAMLEQRGFRNIVHWSRGVDTELFTPGGERFTELPRPVFLFVGRVAVEKNIPGFLGLDLPGTKVVVGDGPQRKSLEARYPDAVFAGAKRGTELASYFRRADVFVFPSRTDTFGLVLVEAMACGTPVAAFPVRGPIDVVTDPAAGVLDEDLGAAALAALRLDRWKVARFSERYSWEHCTRQFVSHLVPARRAEASLAQAA
ncbi:MAG TPA: glycosyltransferase family 1 protein [Usitatibacter sp.]|nr:glycosyltransferase family 1 protein [Usitatibacter sp.]